MLLDILVDFIDIVTNILNRCKNAIYIVIHINSGFVNKSTVELLELLSKLGKWTVLCIIGYILVNNFI